MNLDKLTGIIPTNVLAEIPAVADKFKINTPLRLAHFLSQCAHESSSFKRVNENMNYSANRLKVVFPKYFPGDTALAYARKPEKIGARVYGGRMGNGNEASGEGWTYHGRGFIQLTGKNNYKQLSESIGVDVVADPDKVATTYPLLSAAWFFSTNNINTIADKGATDEVVRLVTRAINGGEIGLKERIKLFHKYYGLLS